VAVLDTTQLDFSRARLPGEAGTRAPDAGPARKAIVVTNPDRSAVLHVGLRPSVPWLEVYPPEFALAPGEAQRVMAEMHPERAGDRAMAPATLAVFGQYIAVASARAGSLPADIHLAIAVIPPISDCPTCGTGLPEGAQECRRCGERIRLCPVCATPNTWIARRCRNGPAHVIRTEIDWLLTPGGDAAHALPCRSRASASLARRWSFPSFPPTRSSDILEWSAPLAAFGMVIAAAIDSTRERVPVFAMALENGTPLWELELSDSRGLYPDRGGMALSEDGMLYAATLGGAITAIDAIRGTLKWTASVTGSVYGALTVTGTRLLVPADNFLHVFDRTSGKPVGRLEVPGRLDTAPSASAEIVIAVGDGGAAVAYSLRDLRLLWKTPLGADFNAAPVIHGDSVLLATLGGEIICLSVKSGAILWQVRASTRPLGATPAVSEDGLLYAGADDGQIHIVAIGSGHLIRSRRVSETPIRCAPIACGNTVIIGADDGSLYSLAPDYAVTRLYETTPGSRISCAGLALYGDDVIVTATNGVLYVLRMTG